MPLTRDGVSVHVVDEVDEAEEGRRRPLAPRRRRRPSLQVHLEHYTGTVSRLTINLTYAHHLRYQDTL